MRLRAVAAVLAAAGFSAQVSLAAELGTLSVSSRLNEPLVAKLTVNDVTEASQPLVLRLAQDAVYAKVGREPIPADLGVKLSLASRDPWVVNITSAKPITQTDMPLIVEMSEAGKLSAKFYRVKLEPSVRPAASVSSTANLKKLPAAEKTAGKLPSAAVAKPQTPSVKAVQPAVKAVSTTETNPYDLKDLTKPTTVKSGMTMWSIARMYLPRYEGARTEEVLVALIRANPKAFDGGRVTGVRNGARLVPPSEKLVRSVGTDVAWCLVHVTPNADARKMPTAAALTKAHARMDKAGIAYQATRLKTSTPAAHPVTPVPKTQPASVSAPVVTQEPAAGEAAQPKREEAPVTPEPSQSQKDAAAAVVTPAVSETVPTQSEAAAELKKAEDLTVTTTTNIRMEELPQPAEESGSGWWWVLLLILLGAGGAGGFFWWKKKEADKQERLCREREIRFKTPAPTTDEQLQSLKTAVGNRMAADAAAARGFAARTPNVSETTASAAAFPASTTSTNSPHPTSGATQTAAPVNPQGAAPVTGPVPSVTPLTDPQEMPKPLTVRSTASGMQFEPLERLDEAETATRKLEEAQAKINEGLPDQAVPLLREVSVTGTPEQKVWAERLLDSVKRD